MRPRPRPWGAVAVVLLVGACVGEAPRQAETGSDDCQYGLVFESATFYAGATDYYFTDRGRTLSFRVESDQIAQRGFADLVTRGEGEPPDTNLAMVGRAFTVCRAGDGYLLRPKADRPATQAIGLAPSCGLSCGIWLSQALGLRSMSAG